MRNKDLIQVKLERFESEVKQVGYSIHKMELDRAYDLIEKLLEKIGDMRTLINTESQD